MKFYTIAISVMVFFFLCSSCEEDPYDQIYKEVDLSCDGISSEFYFEGDLNGEHFCYNVGVDDYDMFVFMVSTIKTNSPSVVLGDSISNENVAIVSEWSIRPYPTMNEHLKHFVMINSPAYGPDDSITLKRIMDEQLTVGTKALASDNNPWTQGVNVIFAVPQQTEGNGGLAFFESRNCNQKNSYFRITEVEKTELPDRDLYVATFEFSCNLNLFGNCDKYYGRIENGKMRMGFALDK